MRCAIYCRLSKEDEDKVQESESIQNQKALLIRHAMEQGWDIHGIYLDEDYSGADRKRPQWRKMLEDAEAGRFEVILCKSQSRFTRDLEMVEKYIHGLFPIWGIRFVALADHVDTQVKGSKKARQINGLINEWYLEDLSDNIRLVLDQKRRDGKHIGSTAAYGYKKDPADKNHLLVDEPAAKIVGRIFQMYLEGMGTGKIAAELSARGVPTPSAYKRGGEDGSRWTRTAVSRILHNQLYTGDLVQGTKRKVSYKSKKLITTPKEEWMIVPGTHAPIVDRETFTAAAKLLGCKARSDGTGQVHLLAGKVFCMDCGGLMCRLSHRYQGERRCYLQCARYASDRAGARCTGHTVRLDLLEQTVALHIGRLLEQYGLLDADAYPNLRRVDQAGTQDPRKEALQRARRKQAQLDRALQSLYLDRADGVIDEQQFRTMNEAFLAQQAQKRAEVQHLSQMLHDTALEQKPAAPAIKEIQELLLSDPMPRELIALLVEGIEIGEKDPSTGTQHVTIRWTV